MAGVYLKLVCLISFVCNRTADISKAPFPGVYLETNSGKSMDQNSSGVVYHLLFSSCSQDFVNFCFIALQFVKNRIMILQTGLGFLRGNKQQE